MKGLARGARPQLDERGPFGGVHLGDSHVLLQGAITPRHSPYPPITLTHHSSPSLPFMPSHTLSHSHPCSLSFILPYFHTLILPYFHTLILPYHADTCSRTLACFYSLKKSPFFRGKLSVPGPEVTNRWRGYREDMLPCVVTPNAHTLTL